MAEIIPDSAIYDFLTSKGVEVEPPKTNKDIKERLVDGAITGLNPLVGAANKYNEKYISTKINKLGHLL